MGGPVASQPQMPNAASQPMQAPAYGQPPAGMPQVVPGPVPSMPMPPQIPVAPQGTDPTAAAAIAKQQQVRHVLNVEGEQAVVPLFVYLQIHHSLI